MLRALSLLPLLTPTDPGAAGVQTWDWQLMTAPFDLRRTVDVMDPDPQDHPNADIDALDARGVGWIRCLSIGTREAGRTDPTSEDVLGNALPDRSDERFLDIRRHDVRLPIMAERFCNAGFDAIEPDNMDAQLNDSGLGLTAGDTTGHFRMRLARADAMGLQTGRKNTPDLVARLEQSMDLAIFESGSLDGGCGADQPRRDAGTPVFAAEYSHPRRTPCEAARKSGRSRTFQDRDRTRDFVTCGDMP
ncbi:endo alpha-1,4 polygalactosaminidase [Sagittula salina]|uniref:Endo alpha-1,4 polygalactosaminidase n=1 Tax=Sagittula salina TaxID=2820268 RepID=A0A940MLY3_9RHOB|nr:endo alpha-1,4 polygalactosaminidase [Sagittula salina]MBP0483926.1 endo alpha-1,4 polygalactosaminidase [Sagittula salina]